MNTISKLLAGAAICALMIGSVSAADVFGQGSTKDAPDLSNPGVVNWTGLYVGGAVGRGNANHDLSVHDFWKDFCTNFDPEAENYNAQIDPHRPYTLGNINGASGTAKECKEVDGNPYKNGLQPMNTASGGSSELARLDGMNTDGLVGDVRIGYDQAMGRIVAGVFGWYGFSDMSGKGTLTAAPFVTGDASLEKGDEWGVGARLGYIVAPRTMAYVLAAYAHTDYDFSVNGQTFNNPTKNLISTNTEFDGIAVGGGVEFAVAANIFFGVEYQHIFYGEETLFESYSKASNAGVRIDDDLDEDKIMATLKFKLNGFGFRD